jgi:CRISPR-associated protein Cmr2
VQQELAELAEPYRLVYPVLGSEPDPEGVTSKVAFLAPPGDGADIAQGSMTEVRGAWQKMITDCFGAKPPDTPGMPDLWWVSVTGSVATDEDYRRLWHQAGDLVVARRRSRVFDPIMAGKTWLCSQSPRLPSVAVPGKARKHEQRERLSTAGWVKRTTGRSHDGPAVRSTPSIASTPYRVALLLTAPDGLADLVGRLTNAAAAVTNLVKEAPVLTNDVPEALAPLNDQLGSWVYPEVWDLASLRREYRSSVTQNVVDNGRGAARELAQLAERAAIRTPTPYFAIVMQDLDRLGRAISRLSLADQRVASTQLVELGAAQREAVESQAHLGVAGYTGGDDLLAFCPAATAITLARTLRKLVDAHLGNGPLATAGEDGAPVTASTAVLYAHMSSPLQTAIAHARGAVEQAKNAHVPGGRNRNAVAIVALRRGGERARSIQPWRIPGMDTDPAADPVTLLETLRPARFALSAGLAAQLERDEPELRQLAGKPAPHETLHAEITRLVGRRGGKAEHADALHQLAWHERSPYGGQADLARYRPVAPLLVARFLAQECG